MKARTLDQLINTITDGCNLALPVNYAGVSMAMTGPILNGNVRDVDLVCLSIGGLQTDILIVTRRVRFVETDSMILGERAAPCFIRAIATKDATCPAIHAGSLAAQKGVPFQKNHGKPISNSPNS